MLPTFFTVIAVADDVGGAPLILLFAISVAAASARGAPPSFVVTSTSRMSAAVAIGAAASGSAIGGWRMCRCVVVAMTTAAPSSPMASTFVVSAHSVSCL